MDNIVYFDNAATTYPKPECVLSDVYTAMKYRCGNPGRGSNKMAIGASEILYEARKLLCDMFSAPSEENVIFTLNATYALNMAIKCFIRARSHVLISDIEHNAVFRPVINEALCGRLSFDIFSTYDGDADSILRDIQKKTRSNTRAIICTACSNICNLQLPLEHIGKYAKDRGMLFIVDASQKAGHSPINMKKENISILCGPSHKGLYGPQGGGFMIIGDRANAYCTIIEGGSGVNSADLTMPDTLPEMFEAGTMSTPTMAGLVSSLNYIKRAGIDTIGDYEKYISGGVRNVICSYPELALHGDYGEGGVFSITSKDHTTEQLAKMLDDENIMIRAGLHCSPLAHKKLGTDRTGTVRLSIGIFNSESDVECLDRAFDRIFRHR